MDKKILSDLGDVANELDRVNLRKEANVLTSIMYRIAFGEGDSNVVVGPYDNPPWAAMDEQAAEKEETRLDELAGQFAQIAMNYCRKILGLKRADQSVEDFVEEWASGNYDRTLNEFVKEAVKQTWPLTSDRVDERSLSDLFLDLDSELSGWLMSGKDIRKEIQNFAMARVGDLN